MRTKNYNLSISLENEKMGPIPNWSLQAGATCPMSCAGCYAGKGNHRFPTVQEARIDNTDFILQCCEKNDFKPFIDEINMFLRSNDMVVNLFRIHESGDFMPGKSIEYGVAYAKAWYTIIKMNPNIKFMAFTKAYNVVRQVPFYELKNMKLVLSSWIGLDIPEDLRKMYKVAWFKDKKGFETRIPDDGFICPGKEATCFKCRYCWNNKATRDTILNEH